MGGRHRRTSGARTGLQTFAVAIAVIALLGGALYGYRQFTADDNGGARCSNPLRLPMAVAPEMVPAAQATATEWARTDVRVGDRCLAVDVTAAESADVATAIAARANGALQGVAGGEQVKVPNIWVPDSSSWLRRLRAAGPNLVPGEAPSVASSPIVVAMPQPY